MTVTVPECYRGLAALDEAQRRLKRRHSFESATQRELHLMDAAAMAVGVLDVLVLLPDGRVGRLRTRGSGLLQDEFQSTPHGWCWMGKASRCGDWVRFQACTGRRVVGLIVDQS